MRQPRRLTIEDVERGTYRGKRILDVSLAAAACIAFAPIVTVIMVAIWLEDRGSPFFAQTRVGGRRKTFRIAGGRSAQHSVRLDRLYLRRQCAALDLRMIALSFIINMVGKTAVRRWIR